MDVPGSLSPKVVLSQCLGHRRGRSQLPSLQESNPGVELTCLCSLGDRHPPHLVASSSPTSLPRGTGGGTPSGTHSAWNTRLRGTPPKTQSTSCC